MFNSLTSYTRIGSVFPDLVCNLHDRYINCIVTSHTIDRRADLLGWAQSKIDHAAIMMDLDSFQRSMFHDAHVSAILCTVAKEIRIHRIVIYWLTGVGTRRQSLSAVLRMRSRLQQKAEEVQLRVNARELRRCAIGDCSTRLKHGPTA
jgi:hypothetical protein